MNRRTLLVLAAVAVLAALLAVIGQQADRGGATVGDMVGTPLIAGLDARLNDLERVSIVTAGDDVAVELVRDNDAWTVAQQDGYPADVTKLREALVALAEAGVVEEKTANPDFYVRLGVDPIELDTAAGTEIRLVAGGEALPAVILGAESGANERFARAADSATSVLIDRNPSFPADPTQWLAPDLIDVRSDRVARVEIDHADGERLVIEKASPDETAFSVRDIPEGRELQYASVANVTGNALRELRLQGARRADDTAPAEVTTVFRTFDGLVVTVTGRTLDGERWIDLSASVDPDAAPDANGAVATDAAANDTNGTSTAGRDARAEADALNARLGGWQFRIPSHIYDQMTRRMDDLLKAPEPADE